MSQLYGTPDWASGKQTWGNGFLLLVALDSALGLSIDWLHETVYNLPTKSLVLSFINRLSPIIDLFFTPWNNKEVLDGISIRKSRQILFDTCEGLNVYEEPVAAGELYFDTFSRYQSWDSPRSTITIFTGCRPRMTLYWCSPPQKKKNSVNFWCPQCCHKQGWLNW